MNYLQRAVNIESKTINFLMTAKRDNAAVIRFFEKASHDMQDNGTCKKVTTDKNGVNTSAID